jgi:hypothetical protein
MYRISGFRFLIFFILVIVNHVLLTESSFMGWSVNHVIGKSRTLRNRIINSLRHRRIFSVVDDDTAASHRQRRRQFSRSPFQFRILLMRGGSDSYSDNEEDLVRMVNNCHCHCRQMMRTPRTMNMILFLFLLYKIQIWMTLQAKKI